MVKSLGRSGLVLDRYDAKARQLRRLELDEVPGLHRAGADSLV